MNKKKLIILTLALSTLGLVSLFGVRAVRAEGSNGHSTLIDKLVERFNLDVGEVEEVFEEFHQERKGEMMARFEERLDQAMAEGELTEEQKEAILAKKAEMEAEHQAMAGLSLEERKEVMDQSREEMRTWAEENGIDLGLFGFGPRPHFGHGFGQ